MGLLSGLGGIASGVMGILGGGKEKKLAKKAFEREDPFGPYRKKYAESLGKLMDDPSSFLQNPLYQAAFDIGTQGVMRGFSKQIGSGNMAVGLQQYSMGFAWDALQEEKKFLAMLAGAGIDPDFSAALSGYAKGVDTQIGGVNAIFKGGMQLFPGSA